MSMKKKKAQPKKHNIHPLVRIFVSGQLHRVVSDAVDWLPTEQARAIHDNLLAGGEITLTIQLKDSNRRKRMRVSWSFLPRETAELKEKLDRIEGQLGGRMKGKVLAELDRVHAHLHELVEKGRRR
jgi:hypothetical protein